MGRKSITAGVVRKVREDFRGDARIHIVTRGIVCNGTFDEPIVDFMRLLRQAGLPAGSPPVSQ